MIQTVQTHKGTKYFRVHSLDCSALIVKFCVIGQRGRPGTVESIRIYDEKLGRRLPMITFEELLLNETVGECSPHAILHIYPCDPYVAV